MADANAMRVGLGYDIHRLEPGDGFMLGGVRLACAYGVVAHSDGDVVLHALTDALLGATGAGDIGERFRTRTSATAAGRRTSSCARSWRCLN